MIECQDEYIGLDTHAFRIKFKFEAITIVSLNNIRYEKAAILLAVGPQIQILLRYLVTYS